MFFSLQISTFFFCSFFISILFVIVNHIIFSFNPNFLDFSILCTVFFTLLSHSFVYSQGCPRNFLFLILILLQVLFYSCTPFAFTPIFPLAFFLYIFCYDSFTLLLRSLFTYSYFSIPILVLHSITFHSVFTPCFFPPSLSWECQSFFSLPILSFSRSPLQVFAFFPLLFLVSFLLLLLFCCPAPSLLPIFHILVSFIIFLLCCCLSFPILSCLL